MPINGLDLRVLFSPTQQTTAKIYPATTADSGNYNLVISDGSCQSSVTTYPVTVNALPTALEINANSPLCEGDELVFLYQS